MGALATNIPGANKVVQAESSGKIANGWLDSTTVFATIIDSTFFIVGDVDATKRLAVQADTQATASTLTLDVGAQTTSRTLTVPALAANTTVAVIGQAQTFAGVQTFGDTTEATAVTTAAQVISGGQGVAKRSFLGTIGASFKGNVVAGVQDATAAVAGQVGENISSTVTGVAVAATGTVGNITSISLTAGDWILSARCVISGGATGLTAGSVQKMSIVTTTATNGVEGSTMQNTSIVALVANGKHALSLPQLRVNIGATTTYYLTEEVSYAAGSPTAAGTLVATRVR